MIDDNHGGGTAPRHPPAAAADFEWVFARSGQCVRPCEPARAPVCVRHTHRACVCERGPHCAACTTSTPPLSLRNAPVTFCARLPRIARRGERRLRRRERDAGGRRRARRRRQPGARRARLPPGCLPAGRPPGSRPTKARVRGARLGGLAGELVHGGRARARACGSTTPTSLSPYHSLPVLTQVRGAVAAAPRPTDGGMWVTHGAGPRLRSASRVRGSEGRASATHLEKSRSFSGLSSSSAAVTTTVITTTVLPRDGRKRGHHPEGRCPGCRPTRMHRNEEATEAVVAVPVTHKVRYQAGLRRRARAPPNRPCCPGHAPPGRQATLHCPRVLGGPSWPLGIRRTLPKG